METKPLTGRSRFLLTLFGVTLEGKVFSVSTKQHKTSGHVPTKGLRRGSITFFRHEAEGGLLRQAAEQNEESARDPAAEKFTSVLEKARGEAQGIAPCVRKHVARNHSAVLTGNQSSA